MSVAERVVTKFGGQTRLAEVLGTGQSTVAYWVKQGRIPSKWHPELLEAATRVGLSLSASDLVAAPGATVIHDRPLPMAAWPGALVLDEHAPAIACYVLDNGQRVISRTSVVAAIAHSGESDAPRKGGDLAKYVKPLGSYLRVNLDDELIEFRIDNVTTKRVQGITAETFLEICRAFVRARDEGALTTERQIEMAKRANAFMAACATVGLIALIDEATGYQYERAEDALQVKLRAFLAEEMREWEKTFPDQLWIEFGRLTGWQGSVQNRPKYWGKLVMELVYGYLDADVAEWLRTNAPAPRKGQNYHQWLSEQYGLQKLVEHIWMLVGIASTCTHMPELRHKMAERFGKQPLQMWIFVDYPK